MLIVFAVWFLTLKSNAPDTLKSIVRNLALATESQESLGTHPPHGWQNLSGFDSLMFILAIVAIVLAIVAIIFAAKQHDDARRTLRTADGMLNELQGMGAELSTRYVGHFPDNLGAITKLLQTATKSVTIIVDFAGYSSYTNPEANQDYFDAVASALRAHPNLTARLYIYDAAQQRRLLQLSRPRTQYTEQQFRDPTNKLLRTFLRRVATRGVSVDNYDSFVEAMLEEEQFYVQQFRYLERCDCYVMTRKVATFVWMVDERECIFAFEDEAEQGTGKNYFSFQTRDGNLIQYLLYYISDVSTRTSQPPSRSVDDVSTMHSIVPSLGQCEMIKKRLTPCRYHRDRMDLMLYEQRDSSGEKMLQEDLVEVSPTPAMLELFELMENRRMPAGHWGLMHYHRAWLTARLIESADRWKADVSISRTILQLGTAGPVHYFGTAKVVSDSLARAGILSATPVDFVTRDRCLAPVESVKCLLAQLARGSTPHITGLIDIDGIRHTIDQTLLDLLARPSAAARLLKHDIALGDICDLDFAKNTPAADVAIAHFTFSMRAATPVANPQQSIASVAAALKPGARLLVALSDFHNPAVGNIQAYQVLFARAGLVLRNSERTWDVYDLSASQRYALIRQQAPQEYPRLVNLDEYEKPLAK